MKKQSGITLVALIITIIVMVILVGVVIVSAVADGGIIDRAQSAMKEKERAEAEELVIASYIYKTTASRTTIVALDLDKTADAIYENLTTNGFILIGANSGEELYTSGDKIELNIQGKHGNYTGTITEKGLENGLKVQDENKIITEEEILIGEYIPNSILGTYYIADMKTSIEFNEDGTITEKGVLGKKPTYTLNEEKKVIVKLGENAKIKDLINNVETTLTFEFNELKDNKILLDKTNGILLAMNRNGLEGKDFEGTWDYYEGSKGDESDHLQIVSNSCKFIGYHGDIDNPKDEYDYFYYNNIFYTWYEHTKDDVTKLTTEFAFYDSSTDRITGKYGDCLTYVRSSS